MAFILKSSQIKPGDTFLCFSGEKTHGLYFLKEALEKGAKTFVLEEKDENLYEKLYGQEDFFFSLVVQKVPSLRTFLLERAQERRKNFQGTLLGITGSVGKTTIKEGLYHLLHQGYESREIFATFDNQNNELGLSLSLANMGLDVIKAIVEMGISEPGEMEKLNALGQPHIGVITNISPQHCGNFSHLEDIPREKSLLLRGCSQGILPRDDDFYDLLVKTSREKGFKGEFITFGRHEKSHSRLMDYKSFSSGLWNEDLKSFTEKMGQGRIKASFFGEEWTFEIPDYGAHWAMNSVLLATLGLLMGLKKEHILGGLKTFHPPKGRGNRLDTPQGFVLWDHTYNGALEAFRAGLQNFKEQQGKKYLFLGDMAELGDKNDELHENLVPFINATKAQGVFLIGPSMSSLEKKLHSPVVAKGQCWEDIFPSTLPLLREKAHFFFKGSRKMKLEKCMEKILENIKNITI